MTEGTILDLAKGQTMITPYTDNYQYKRLLKRDSAP